MREEEYTTEPFQMRVEAQDDIAHARLSGEFDYSSEAEFSEQLGKVVKNGVRRVVVDLRGLTFIDSSGIRAVLSAWRRSRNHDIEFALVPGPDQVRQVLSLTGIDRVIPVIDDPASPA
jgi:anti-sigma B factor antagonist